MNPKPNFAQRLVLAALVAFLLVAAGAPVARAGDDRDGRRGRHHDDFDRHDRKEWKKKRGKGCWHPGRRYDPYWGRGHRKCRRPHRHHDHD
jgi:hypothetical protein